MIIYSIYKFVNLLNGKIYIGYTSNLKKRLKSHKKSIENPKYTSIFHSSVRKHGWNNFHLEIIYQSKDGEHCLNIMEPYFIKQFESFGEKGYNMTEGGEGSPGFKHNTETKYIIGSRTRGKTLPESHKTKISKSHIGIKPSEKTRKLMSENRKGRKWYNNGIKNTQSKTNPGEGWVSGRVNRKSFE